MTGRVMLGFLSRERAIEYLRSDCHFKPQMSVRAAAALWRKYRKRVAELNRSPVIPPQLKPTDDEEAAARQWFVNPDLACHKAFDRIVKVDPSLLIPAHPFINLDHAAEVAVEVARGRATAASLCLRGPLPPTMIPVETVTDGWNFKLPHWGCLLEYDGVNFRISQGVPVVSIVMLPDRAILWNGHRRSFGLMTSRPGTSILAAVHARSLDDDKILKPIIDAANIRTPPLVGDFFDERLYLDVPLRDRRYELQVRARRVAIDV